MNVQMATDDFHMTHFPQTLTPFTVEALDTQMFPTYPLFIEKGLLKDVTRQ